MDLEEIQQLIIEEIAGTLTPEQQACLKQIITEDKAAFALWQDMHQVLHSGKVEQAKAGLDMERPGEIIAAHQRRKKKTYILRTAGVAAATLAAAAICWQLFLKPVKQPDAALLADNKHISLHLSNGRTIDLSTAGQQVQVDNMTLNNSNKKLSYTAATASPQLITLRIPAGKDYNIVLSDGTEIMLNSATTLQFPSAFTGSTREVTIQGEAFLKVAKQADKPFLVHLPGNTVRVLGTDFNVNSYDPTQVKVALVKGSVKVVSPRDSITLKPGYQAASSSAALEMDRFDEEEVLSWQQGIYNFYNTPFSEAASVISRWYGIDFVIDDPALSNRRFTGVIDRNKPVQVFLNNMKATNGLHYHISGETIHIK
jgi:ferric-dicitrate binding protein FerR (iron transport regulator)